ncbi:hypothetical protein RCH10_000172 [Variovorax sp. GrIS 2.14]
MANAQSTLDAIKEAHARRAVAAHGGRKRSGAGLRCNFFERARRGLF